MVEVIQENLYQDPNLSSTHDKFHWNTDLELKVMLDTIHTLIL